MDGNHHLGGGCVPSTIQKDAVLAAMMEDLGNDRLEELATDDGGRNSSQPRFAQRISSSFNHSMPQNPRNAAWHAAMNDGTFDDSDAIGVRHLDTIASGSLHRQSRGSSAGAGSSSSNRAHIRKPYNPMGPVSGLHANHVMRDFMLPNGFTQTRLGALLPPGMPVQRWNPDPNRATKPKSPALTANPIPATDPKTPPPTRDVEDIKKDTGSSNVEKRSHSTGESGTVQESTTTEVPAGDSNPTSTDQNSVIHTNLNKSHAANHGFELIFKEKGIEEVFADGQIATNVVVVSIEKNSGKSEAELVVICVLDKQTCKITKDLRSLNSVTQHGTTVFFSYDRKTSDDIKFSSLKQARQCEKLISMYREKLTLSKAPLLDYEAADTPNLPQGSVNASQGMVQGEATRDLELMFFANSRQNAATTSPSQTVAEPSTPASLLDLVVDDHSSWDSPCRTNTTPSKDLHVQWDGFMSKKDFLESDQPTDGTLIDLQEVEIPETRVPQFHAAWGGFETLSFESPLPKDMNKENSSCAVAQSPIRRTAQNFKEDEKPSAPIAKTTDRLNANTIRELLDIEAIRAAHCAQLSNAASRVILGLSEEEYVRLQDWISTLEEIREAVEDTDTSKLRLQAAVGHLLKREDFQSLGLEDKKSAVAELTKQLSKLSLHANSDIKISIESFHRLRPDKTLCPGEIKDFNEYLRPIIITTRNTHLCTTHQSFLRTPSKGTSRPEGVVESTPGVVTTEKKIENKLEQKPEESFEGNRLDHGNVEESNSEDFQNRIDSPLRRIDGIFQVSLRDLQEDSEKFESNKRSFQEAFGHTLAAIDKKPTGQASSVSQRAENNGPVRPTPTTDKATTLAGTLKELGPNTSISSTLSAKNTGGHRDLWDSFFVPDSSACNGQNRSINSSGYDAERNDICQLTEAIRGKWSFRA